MSRGAEQITVRASRRLAPDSRRHRDRSDPLRGGRADARRCASGSSENDCQPIAFDWSFEAAVPPFLEDRSHTRAAYRTSTDLVRYHQTGVASGWVEVDGERIEIDPDTWVSTRDHSWGVRYDVGVPRRRRRRLDGDDPGRRRLHDDLEPDAARARRRLALRAAPPLHALHGAGLRADAGDRRCRAPRRPARADRRDRARPALRSASNRRLLGGTLLATLADGTERGRSRSRCSATPACTSAPVSTSASTVTTTASSVARCTSTASASPTAARPRSPAACTRSATPRSASPIPSAAASGYGNCQPMAVGPWPDLGLADENWL